MDYNKKNHMQSATTVEYPLPKGKKSVHVMLTPEQISPRSMKEVSLLK